MYDIACGIPSYNEEDSISNVARHIDTGLGEYFPGQRAVIINMDSCSTDMTREAFMETPTRSEKKILMKEGVRGKGNMVEMLLEFIMENGVEHALMADADLESITSDWVYLLMKPVLDGYDYCTPLYSRHKYDGTITNLVVYPVVCGLYGHNIRQPIGGDFAFSRKSAELWLEEEWLETTRHYGIDNFLTTTAVCNGLKICQAKLGAKIHKASAPKLGRMFLQVVETLFTNVYRCMGHILGVKEMKEPDVFGSVEELPRKVGLDRESTEEKTLTLIQKHSALIERIIPGDAFSALREGINPDAWCRIVYSFLLNFRKENKADLLDAFSGLYFRRILSFIDETKDIQDESAEDVIRKNAQIFYEKRNVFIDAAAAGESSQS